MLCVPFVLVREELVELLRGGTAESSEGSVYTIEQGIPATAAVMKKKDVQWVQSLSDLGF